MILWCLVNFSGESEGSVVVLTLPNPSKHLYDGMNEHAWAGVCLVYAQRLWLNVWGGLVLILLKYMALPNSDNKLVLHGHIPRPPTISIQTSSVVGDIMMKKYTERSSLAIHEICNNFQTEDAHLYFSVIVVFCDFDVFLHHILLFVCQVQLES